MPPAAPQFSVTVRVRPGASRNRVGGRYGQDALGVAVTARAVDGAATASVLAAVARAFGVRTGDVQLRVGHTSRTKVLTIAIDPTRGSARLVELLSQ